MFLHQLCQSLVTDSLLIFCEYCFSLFGTLVSDPDLVGHLEICFLTHGLDLADNFADKAFFDQFWSQVCIQDNCYIIIFFCYISIFLCYIDQQVILCKNNFLSVKVKG
mgnify:CR=1 FL=1